MFIYIVFMFFIMVHVFVVNNKRSNSNVFSVKIIENNAVQSVQEHLHITLQSAKVILVSFTSSIFSLHSSTNLWINLFPHLQF